MSPPLTYFPTYLGLFAAQLLAMTCNAFLDIHYQTFGTEVTVWAIGFGLSLAVGCAQRGEIKRIGKTLQTIVTVLGMLFFLVFLLRLWGLPRAGVALLAILQIAYNCVTVTRRHLHLGLLSSAVMVIFAASHYRAHWSMLFYLVPYLIAVVGTLVAEQINRRVDDLKKGSLGQYLIGGQSAAIAAATATILLLGALLYAMTPQVSWQYLDWRYGQLVHGKSSDTKPAGPDGSVSGDASGQGGKAAQSGSEEPGEAGLQSGLGWPSPDDMRKTAGSAGMPQWQGDTIRALADVTETVTKVMQPVLQILEDQWENFKKWLEENREAVERTIFALLLAALLLAFWRFFREVKPGIWLLSQWDYLRLGLSGRHAKGRDGARQYYSAMERLLSLQDAQRPQQINTREYLAMLRISHAHATMPATRMTLLFEEACYGPGPFSDLQLEQMRSAYRELYKSVFNEAG